MSDEEKNDAPSAKESGGGRGGRRRTRRGLRADVNDDAGSSDGGDGGESGGSSSRRGRGRGQGGGKDSKGGDKNRRGRNRRKGGGREVEELGATTGIDVLDAPSERGNGQGRELPGLNLKDLLPFLRPPKTIFVMGASTGGGHNRAAQAIFEAMKALDRNLVVRQHDLIDLVEKNPGSAAVRQSLEDLSRDPKLFGTPFDTVDAKDDGGDADASDPLDGIFDEALDHVVVDKRPDWIVCTHWLALAHLKSLKERDRLNAEVMAVVPDPDLHPRWISDVVDQWIVPEEGMRARLVDAGVDATNVAVAGVPVSASFGDAIDRGAVARELEIDRSNTTILLRPGGIGETERIGALLGRLASDLDGVNLLVLAGKNERLKEIVEGLETGDGVTAKAFGFVDNIHEFMAIADVLVTRASTHTVAEAAASGLPMVLLRPSPGTEDRMADRLLRRGVAVKAYCDEDLLATLGDFISNKRTLRELKESAERQRRPDIVHAVVQRIARVVK